MGGTAAYYFDYGPNSVYWPGHACDNPIKVLSTEISLGLSVAGYACHLIVGIKVNIVTCDA